MKNLLSFIAVLMIFVGCNAHYAIKPPHWIHSCTNLFPEIKDGKPVAKCICKAKVDDETIELIPSNGCVGYASTPQDHLEDLINWTYEMDQEIRSRDN